MDIVPPGITIGPGFNANGIETTPDGKALLVIQSNTGILFRVSPRTGVATPVDVRGADLTNGDGILRRGRTLFVVAREWHGAEQLSTGAGSGQPSPITRSGPGM